MNAATQNGIYMSNRRCCFISFFVIVIALLISYSCFLVSDVFSIDSYINWYEIDLDVHLRNSRLVTWAIMSIAKAVGLNTLHFQVISKILFILGLSALGAWLSSMIVANAEQRSVFLVVSTSIAVSISFANTFFWEWFVFVESYLWYLSGIAFVMIALHFLYKGKMVIVSVLMILCAMLTYQILIPMFAVWGIALVLCNNRFRIRKQFYKDIALLCLVTFVGALTGLLVGKAIELSGIVTLSRSGANDLSTIHSNLIGIAKLQEDIWINGCFFLPKYSLLVFLGIAILLLIVGLRHSGWRNAFLVLFAIVVGYVCAFAPHFFLASQWYAPRTLEGVGCFWTLLWLVTIHANSTKHSGKILVTVALLGFFTLNASCIWGATITQHQVNEADKKYSCEVDAAIHNLEHATNSHVQEIRFINDPQPTYAVTDNRYRFYGTNSSAAPTEWALVYMIDYYCNEDYSGEMMSELEAKTIFEDAIYNDFEEFDSQTQVKVENKTAYLIVR